MDHPKTTPEPFFNKGRHAQHPYFQIPESTTQRIFFSAAPEDFEATALVNGLTQMATSWEWRAHRLHQTRQVTSANPGIDTVCGLCDSMYIHGSTPATIQKR